MSRSKDVNNTDYSDLVAQLKQREREFRSLAENSPDNIIRYDKDARIIYVNHQLEKTLGVPAAELIGKTHVELQLHECDIDKQGKIEQAIESGESIDYYVTLPDKGEGERYHHLRMVPERDDDGNICGLISIGRDITELKLAEAKLEREKTTLKTFFDAVPGMVWVKGLDNKYIACNPQFEHFLGLAEAEIIGKTDADFFDAEKAAFFVQKDKEAIAAGCPTTNHETVTLASNGTRLLLETTKSPILDANGNISGVLGIGRDITIHKDIERQLQTILDNHPDVIVRYDISLRRVYVNPQYERVNGFRSDEVLGKTPSEKVSLIGPIVDDYQDKIKSVFATGKAERIDFNWINDDGNETSFNMHFIPEFDEYGEVTTVLNIARDISDVRKANHLLKTKEHEFRTLVENSPDMIVRYDRNCQRVFVNQAYRQHMGMKSDEDLNRDIKDANKWLPTMSLEHYHQRLRHIMETGTPDKILKEWMRYDGVTVSHEMYVVPEYGVDGNVIGALALGRDVTRSKQVEQQLKHQASYDLLTGLPNRRFFRDKLQESMSDSNRKAEGFSLLFIDLDRFKSINDTMGHEVGDQLLIGVAQRIKKSVRDTDVVARLAGDEFVVILPGNTDVDALERLVRDICEIIAQPFYFEQHHTHTSACIGIAIYPQDATTAEDLISCADQAMYTAKKSGQNSYNFFNHDMLVTAKRNVYLANELHEALNKQQLEVYYQPIINVNTGQTIKAEALIRWHHPQMGMVSPEQFIPLAEETDLIQDIGFWVYREAANAVQQWHSAVDDGLQRQISVNMSPRQFRKGNAAQQFIEFSSNEGHDPAHIAIEITEGLLLDDSIDTTMKLESLRESGFEISLDDFGTGHSALAYLKKFNIDYLKIDRSFVSDLETDAAAQAIAEAIVVMAHRLGLKVIAEGVETPKQYELLSAMNCEYMQGYLFAKPMPLVSFIGFVNKGVCIIQQK